MNQNLAALDLERESSMADEGGVSAALIETETPPRLSAKTGLGARSSLNRSLVKVTLGFGFGVLAGLLIFRST